MIVFLGLPLVIFIVFVIVPFVQAVYYSMTQWGGFSPDKKFTGLDNYRKLLQDDTFLHRAAQQHRARHRGPACDDHPGAGDRQHRDGRRPVAWAGQRNQGLEPVPGCVVLPLLHPGNRDRPDLGAGLRPVGRNPQCLPYRHRIEPIPELRLAGRGVDRDARLHVRDHLGLRRVLRGAVRGLHQGHPGRDLRGRPPRRSRPVPDLHLGDHPADPGHRPDGRHLHRHRRAGRVRLHVGAEPVRRPQQFNADHVAGPVQHGVPQGPVRLCHRDGGHPRHRHAAVRCAGVHDQPPDRRRKAG